MVLLLFVRSGNPRVTKNLPHPCVYPSLSPPDLCAKPAFFPARPAPPGPPGPARQLADAEQPVWPEDYQNSRERPSSLNISGSLYFFITMIREIVARLRTRAKEIAEACFEKIRIALTKCTPTTNARACTSRLIVPTGSGDALNAGKRYRLTSGHAPVFSLWTFFGNR